MAAWRRARAGRRSRPGQGAPRPAAPGPDRILALREIGIDKSDDLAKISAAIDRYEAAHRPVSSARVISEMRAVANSAMDDRAPYLEMVRDVAQRFGARVDDRNLLKSVTGIATKVLDDYDDDAKMIKDALRSTIVVDDVGKVPEIIEALRDYGYQLVGDVKNTLDQGVPGDIYRDAKINIRMPNGTISEIQINHPAMIEAKDNAHPLYKRMQEIERSGDRSGRAKIEAMTLRELQGEIYAPAWREALRLSSSARNSSLETSRHSGWNMRENLVNLSPPSGLTSKTSISGDMRSRLSLPVMKNISRHFNLDASSITSPPSGMIVSLERKPDETDKDYAKRVIDFGPMPESLPEVHWRYFNMDAADAVVPVSQLVSTKTESENEKGGGNAPKRMRAAYDGILGKRDPITVRQRPDGRYDVIDGNGTLTGVSMYGWKSLLVRIEDRALGAGDRVAGLTGELSIGRPVGNKLIAERTGKRVIPSVERYIKANPESGINYAHGKVAGFPSFIENASDIEKEILRAVRDIKERDNRDDTLWYQTAGRTIWKYANGDIKRADLITRLTAKFAQTMGVRENTTALLQALEAIRKGEPIRAGRYPEATRKEIEKLLAAKEVNVGLPGINRKLASFYWNLWDEVRLAAGLKELRPNLITVDQHINSYAQHQKVTDVSPQEYGYADMILREATRRLNEEGFGLDLIGRDLKPRDVQSIVWGFHKRAVLSGRPLH